MLESGAVEVKRRTNSLVDIFSTPNFPSLDSRLSPPSNFFAFSPFNSTSDQFKLNASKDNFNISAAAKKEHGITINRASFDFKRMSFAIDELQQLDTNHSLQSPPLTPLNPNQTNTHQHQTQHLSNSPFLNSLHINSPQNLQRAQTVPSFFDNNFDLDYNDKFDMLKLEENYDGNLFEKESIDIFSDFNYGEIGKVTAEQSLFKEFEFTPSSFEKFESQLRQREWKSKVVSQNESKVKYEGEDNLSNPKRVRKSNRIPRRKPCNIKLEVFEPELEPEVRRQRPDEETASEYSKASHNTSMVSKESKAKSENGRASRKLKKQEKGRIKNVSTGPLPRKFNSKTKMPKRKLLATSFKSQTDRKRNFQSPISKIDLSLEMDHEDHSTHRRKNISTKFVEHQNESFQADLASAIKVHRFVGNNPEQVGAYSPNSRRELIERWLEKRKKRDWTKKIKYPVRKEFADSRLRVKGRFISKENESTIRETLMLTF